MITTCPPEIPVYLWDDGWKLSRVLDQDRMIVRYHDMQQALGQDAARLRWPMTGGLLRQMSDAVLTWGHYLDRNAGDIFRISQFVLLDADDRVRAILVFHLYDDETTSSPPGLYEVVSHGGSRIDDVQVRGHVLGFLHHVYDENDTFDRNAMRDKDWRLGLPLVRPALDDLRSGYERSQYHQGAKLAAARLRSGHPSGWDLMIVRDARNYVAKVNRALFQHSAVQRRAMPPFTQTDDRDDPRTVRKWVSVWFSNQSDNIRLVLDLIRNEPPRNPGFAVNNIDWTDRPSFFWRLSWHPGPSQAPWAPTRGRSRRSAPPVELGWHEDLVKLFEQVGLLSSPEGYDQLVDDQIIEGWPALDLESFWLLDVPLPIFDAPDNACRSLPGIPPFDPEAAA